MTFEQAFKTGELADEKPETAPGCGDVFVVLRPDRAALAMVEFDKEFGLVKITADSGLVTPEGIEPGSTYDEVAAAYPNWDRYGVGGPDGHYGWVDVPGQEGRAHYVIEVMGGLVVSLDLRLVSPC